MPNLHPITPEIFGGKSWRRPSGFGFAAGDALAPLTGSELPKATQSFAIGFIKEDKKTVPAALLGYENHQNLYVDQNGRWLGAYVPNGLKTYPFRLGDLEDGSKILCIDTDSGLVLDTAEGEPFYGEGNTAGETIGQIFSFLSQMSQEQAATLKVCAVLSDLGLVVPWDIEIPTEAGPKKVAGLHRIDEMALSEMDCETFEQIRKVHALPIIYSQLLSMQNLDTLTKLDRLRQQNPTQPSLTEGLDLGNQGDDSTVIDFSKIGI